MLWVRLLSPFYSRGSWGRERLNRLHEVSKWLQVAPGLDSRCSGPTAPPALNHIAVLPLNWKSFKNLKVCLWNVGICHYGMLTESNFWSWLSWTHILYINVYLHGTNVVFLNGCFLTFWFFSSLGLLSRLMWPLFHVTSKTPLYLQLRKVSMSLLDRLSDFCPVCSPVVSGESVFASLRLTEWTPQPSASFPAKSVAFQKTLALREFAFEELQASREK